MATGDPARWYGAGYGALFSVGSGPVQTTPWGRAARRKRHRDFDPGIVGEAIRALGPLHAVDPRSLKATQPAVTAPGVSFYLDPIAEQTGVLYADHHDRSNQFPIIYSRYDQWPPGPEDEPTNLILAGHHRSTAALLTGRPVLAIRVDGPWGPHRDRSV